tara:strand:+ start:513 stop:1766 length:1254 start_codon:yes stop_codon:yes gene_type:complete
MTQSFNSEFANNRNNSVDRSLEATIAREEAGLNAALEAEAQQQAQQQQEEAGPGAQPQPGATIENEGVHQVTAADVIRQEKCDEKIVLLTPDPDSLVKSSIKGIQTAIENMTKKIDKFLQSIQSYIDAVTNKIQDIRSFIRGISGEIAKYMKIIFDKVMEYAIKIINKQMNKVVAALPSSLRYQFSDLKEITTELILCLYGKMTGNLTDQVSGVLDDILKLDDLEKEARDRAAVSIDDDGNVNGETTYPKAPICTAEDITSRVMSLHVDEIDKANVTLLDNIDAYLEDITDTLAGVTGNLQDVKNLIGNFKGSITSALTFTNFSPSVFGCELKPNQASTDYYTFCSGGSGQARSELPSERSLGDRVNKDTPTSPPKKTQPFVEPTRATPDVVDDIDRELDRARAGDRSGLDDALDIS